MFEKEAEEYAGNREVCDLLDAISEDLQNYDYSLFDFVMKYENGKFKCEYKSGKEFESVDGKTLKEIVLPKESE